MLKQLNSPTMYLICGTIIAFVALVCVVFMIRAYRAGKALGMDPAKLKRTITSSVTFSILPSVGILLGVIALSGSLGTPWPWLRLSVIGALHYETQVAQAAAEAVGIGGLSAEHMTPKAFATIAFLMSICIMWGMILSLFFNKAYLKKIQKQSEKTNENASEPSDDDHKITARKRKTGLGDNLGDVAMNAMFIGLVSAYLGSYIGGFVSGKGVLTFSGDLTPIIVCIVSAAVMAVFTALAQKKNMRWLESFSIAGSMLIGMLAAIVV